jgi:tRNA pseudouridine55 synthase
MNRQRFSTAYALDGVFVIDKPRNLTSHDVVDRVREILKTRRVGHTGTLDPFATGVLVICVNRATRLSQFLTGEDKEYLAAMQLGLSTDTGDLTGRPKAPAIDASHINEESVKDALEHFRGRIQQTPPMYSAKKIDGVKLYKMARRGEEAPRRPVDVVIRELELIDRPDSSEISEPGGSTGSEKIYSFRVVCSSGTYIRTLAEDIGNYLGVGAHLIELRRIRSGGCSLKQAITLEKLAEQAEAGCAEDAMIGMADALSMIELPAISDDERRSITHGRPIEREGNWEHGSRAKLCDSNAALIAIAEYDAERRVWRPRIVF